MKIAIPSFPAAPSKSWGLFKPLLFWRFDWRLNPSPPSLQQKGVGAQYEIFHHATSYFSIFFQPVSLVFSSQHWFSSHLDNYFPSSIIYFPSPGNFPIVWSFNLSSSRISTNFHAHCFFHRFSSPSVNSSSTSYIHFPSPGKLFQLFGPFFQSIYSDCFFSQFFGHFLNPMG